MKEKLRILIEKYRLTIGFSALVSCGLGLVFILEGYLRATSFAIFFSSLALAILEWYDGNGINHKMVSTLSIGTGMMVGIGLGQIGLGAMLILLGLSLFFGLIRVKGE